MVEVAALLEQPGVVVWLMKPNQGRRRKAVRDMVARLAATDQDLTRRVIGKVISELMSMMVSAGNHDHLTESKQGYAAMAGELIGFASRALRVQHGDRVAESFQDDMHRHTVDALRSVAEANKDDAPGSYLLFRVEMAIHRMDTPRR